MDRKYLEREYDMWTNQYQEELPPLEAIELIGWSQVILQAADEIKAKTTLETGAGSGKFSFMLANKGYEATIMDFNKSILKTLKRNNSKVKKPIKIVEGNILNIPFPDNSFDLVFSEGVNEHFLGADREKAIREMVRVSKNKIIIFVPDAQSEEYIKRNDPLDGEYPFTKAELTDLCELCGIQITGTGRLGDQIFIVGCKIVD